MTASPLTSRFQIVERPYVHPGKCCVCGCTDRPCVDIGLDVDDYGVVYFCIPCLTEAANVIGLVPEQRVHEAELAAGQSISDYLKARELSVVTNGQLDTLRNSIVSLSSAIVPVVFGDVPDSSEPTGTDAESVDHADAEGSEGHEASSGQGGKSARGRRSSSVPADSSNDFLGLGTSG